MLLSQIRIAQLALQHLGEDDRIPSLDEDSKAARAVKSAWDPTRLFVLSEANWSHAIVTRALAKRPVDADWPVALERNAFPLPAEMVRFVEFVDPALEEEDDSFTIEAGPTGMEILCDESGPITVRYVIDTAAIADPARWPPAFTKAFGFYLAWQISDALAATKARKDRALGGYENAMRLARRVNTKTKGRRGDSATPWSMARTVGSGRAPNT